MALDTENLPSVKVLNEFGLSHIVLKSQWHDNVAFVHCTYLQS